MNGRSLMLAVVAAAILSLTVTSTASAHARYKSSTPGMGEVVTASPAQVTITFTQHVQKVAGGYAIDVAKDRGESVTSGPTVIDENDRTTMSVPLQPNLEAGRYVVNFKNVSDDDGDPFNGAFSFYVNKQPNAVDLDNDQKLTLVGADTESPTVLPGTGTAIPGSPVAPVTPPSGATLAAGSATARAAGGQATPTSIATPVTTTSSSGMDSSTIVVIAVAVVVVVAVVGGGGWIVLSNRRK